MNSSLVSRIFLLLVLICLYNVAESHQLLSLQPIFRLLWPVTGKVQISPQIPGYYLEQGTCSYCVCRLMISGTRHFEFFILLVIKACLCCDI